VQLKIGYSEALPAQLQLKGRLIQTAELSQFDNTLKRKPECSYNSALVPV